MQDDIETTIRLVHAYFINSNYTLSVAESCTGGLICSLLTDVPGASRFLKGGVVTYWSESKIEVLGVSHKTINLKGAISSETAIEMAEKVRILFSSDCGLSITGNLGPDTIEGKELGLVYIGVSKKGRMGFTQITLSGDRLQNKMSSALLALKFLLDF